MQEEQHTFSMVPIHRKTVKPQITNTSWSSRLKFQVICNEKIISPMLSQYIPQNSLMIALNVKDN